MKDLTHRPVSRLLVQMAVPMAIGMLFQTLYLLSVGSVTLQAVTSITLLAWQMRRRLDTAAKSDQPPAVPATASASSAGEGG
jgi:hypothetical protein